MTAPKLEPTDADKVDAVRYGGPHPSWVAGVLALAYLDGRMAERRRAADERLDILVRIYGHNHYAAAAVAWLCDEHLDRSGGLLGRVRVLAREG